jgi:hypothetical protein
MSPAFIAAMIRLTSRGRPLPLTKFVVCSIMLNYSEQDPMTLDAELTRKAGCIAGPDLASSAIPSYQIELTPQDFGALFMQDLVWNQLRSGSWSSLERPVAQVFLPSDLLCRNLR